MSQALAQEVAPFGIRVLIPELGSFRTNFLGATAMQVSEASKPYIGGAVDESLKLEFEKNGKQPGDPEKAVRVLFDVVLGRGPGEGNMSRLRLPLGQDSLERGLEQANMMIEDFNAFRDAAVGCGFVV
jgi:hypothetical protein